MTLAPRSLAGYDTDFRQFTEWFDGDWRTATGDDVAAYLRERANGWLTRNTLIRYRAALCFHFERAGVDPSPTYHTSVKQFFADLDHVRPDRPKVLGLTHRDMVKVVDAMGTTPKDLRDKAMMLVGWWGKLEREALVKLNVHDVTELSNFRWSIIVRSDHRQHGTRRGSRDTELDLIKATQAWCDVVGLEQGPLWRRVDRHHNVGGSITAQSVSLVVKDRVSAALGHDPDRYSANTLATGPMVLS